MKSAPVAYVVLSHVHGKMYAVGLMVKYEDICRMDLFTCPPGIHASTESAMYYKFMRDAWNHEGTTDYDKAVEAYEATVRQLRQVIS